jgi:hypothetical protein
MLSIVVWRWGTRYNVDYVNRLYSMLSRHLHIKHQLYCITDDPINLNKNIKAIPLWPSTLQRARRLQVFSKNISQYVDSERILHLDIDCIIVNDITPLVERSEPLVMWKAWAKSTSVPYNASIILRNANVLSSVWDDYTKDGHNIELEAKKLGLWTTLCHQARDKHTKEIMHLKYTQLDHTDDDQAVLSLYAQKLNPPVWSENDGIYKFGWNGFANKNELPPNARIVFFNGSIDQNLIDIKYEWIKNNWK